MLDIFALLNSECCGISGTLRTLTSIIMLLLVLSLGYGIWTVLRNILTNNKHRINQQ